MKVYIRSQVIKKLGSDLEVNSNKKTLVDTLNQFMENPTSEGLNLEKLQQGAGSQPLYSIRYNEKSRIILCPIKTNHEGQVWVVTKVLLDHEYKRLKRRGVAVLSTDELKELQQACSEPGSGKSEKVQVTIAETDRVEFINQQYILLDEEQDGLKAATLPLIISGAPGSGKTSTLLTIIKNNLTRWAEQKQDAQPVRILVLAKSKHLVDQMKKEWEEMYKEDWQDMTIGLDCVQFQTPEDVYRANHVGQDVIFIGEPEFIKWYLDYAKKHNIKSGKGASLPLDAANAALIYQELHTMSGYSKLEDYNDQVNDRLSLFADASSRKAIWQVYEAYRNYLKQGKEVDLAFNPIVLSQQYDFIGVDETQDLSRQQQRSLVQVNSKTTRKRLVLCVGDHQRLFGSETTIPFLSTLFWEAGQKEVVKCKALHASYRCAEPIVRFANAGLYLKYQVIGGSAVADNNELPFITSVEQQKEGSVIWLGGSDAVSVKNDSEKLELIARNNRANVDFVVITSPKYFDDAVRDFGRERVFTAKQMKGLQAKEILLYRFFEQDDFKAANKPISQGKEKIDLQKALKEGKIPKGCRAGSICHNNIFNELFVAITRAQTSLIIYQPLDSKKHHDIAAITGPLHDFVTKSPSDYTLSQEINVSTEDDWRKRVEELKARAKSDSDPRLHEMILEIEKRYLKQPFENKQEVTNLGEPERSDKASVSQVNATKAAEPNAIKDSTSRKKRLQGKPPTVKNQPSTQPYKKETKKESQDMEATLTSLKPADQLDLLITNMLEGKPESVKKFFKFDFNEIAPLQMPKEEVIGLNLPAMALIDKLLNQGFKLMTLPAAFIDVLAAYLMEMSKSEDREKQDAFMAVFNYRNPDWNLPLALPIRKKFLDKAPAQQPGTTFMQKMSRVEERKKQEAVEKFAAGFMQMRSNELNSEIEAGKIGAVGKLKRLGLLDTVDTKNNLTPLQIASQTRNVALINALAKAGANLNLATKFGDTPLSIAVVNGHEEAVKALIARKVNVSTVNNADRTPLSIAVKNNYKNIVIALLDAKAETNTPNGSPEYSPLHSAVFNGNEDIVSLLINAGADINRPDFGGDTPLLTAIKTKNKKIINLLIDSGADINIPNESEMTALHMAVRMGSMETVAVLLKHKDVQLDRPGFAGGTPLSMAADERNEKIVEALIEAGADVNCLNCLGETPLYIAIERKASKIAIRLIDAKADVNVNASEMGETPLYMAVCNSDKEVVDKLIKAGADVNKVNQEGRSPLLAAAFIGDINIVSALLSAESCNFDAYQISIEELEEAISTYGNTQAKGRAKKFTETRQVNEEGNLSILPHEVAAIMGHNEVKKLIYNKMVDQSIKNTTTPYGFFRTGIDDSGEVMDKVHAMAKR